MTRRWLVLAACCVALADLAVEPADHACADLLAATKPTELCEAPDHFNHISASTERTNKATGRADEGVARLN